MGRADYYAPGDYNASCFECGRKFKASELKRHWKGYYVCKDHWEVRQPQDFVRAMPDIQTVAWSQPEVTDKFAWESVAGLITSDTVLGSSASTVTVGDASGVTITITLPAAPITNQIITVDNIGAGVAIVVGAAAPVSVAAYTTAWFVWDGYTWGCITGMFCDAVVLPTTKDFGVVQYAGPAETAYGVPQTTVEYENIGYTPCGGLLRKIITTTYSGRSVADQWRATAILTQIGVAEQDGTYGGSVAWLPLNNTLVAYGETAPLVSTAVNYAFWLINPTNGWSNGVSRGVKPGFIDTNGVMYSGASNLWSNNTFLQLTLYYLDIQIVWTYEII